MERKSKHEKALIGKAWEFSVMSFALAREIKTGQIVHRGHYIEIRFNQLFG